MQTTTSLHGSLSRRASRRLRSHRLAALTVATVSAGALLAGCGSSTASSTDSRPSGGKDGSSSPEETENDQRVLWMGDSIAAAEAPALQAALEASGAEFENASSDGGGTVVEGDKDAINSKIAKTTWKGLEKSINGFRPNLIAYQITTYDWGTPEQQETSYEKLARTAQDAGAELVIVSTPPFKRDDFYKPYDSALESAPRVAEQVADAGGDQVHFFDSAQLWGTDHGADKAQRAPDGIHSCQQGSAAFAEWFTGRLAEQAGFTPAPAKEWAIDSWTDDERFAKLGCG